MSSPSRPAWWPTAVAGLLLASGGGWLLRALPSPPVTLAARVVPTSGVRPGARAARPPALAPRMATPEPAPETLADTAVRFTTYAPLAGDTLGPPRVPTRRYVGTLGGRAIVVQLVAGATWATGSWYYRTGRQAHERQLVFRERRGQQLVLGEALVAPHPADADTGAAEWRLPWPLGRVLAGERRGAARQAVALREDYAQAVPYQLLGFTAHGHRCDALPGRSQPYYSAEFVQLLGADSLRLSLWQAPPPAARRDSLRHWLCSESCQQTNKRTDVTLNDYDLWSWNVRTDAYYYGTHHEHAQEGFIVDSRTGDEWLVEELLRPGTELALRQLLARHLQRDYPEVSQAGSWDWKTVPPLPYSFALTPTGLYAGYDDYALTGSPTPYVHNTTIPYAELRPLVRPGTPLAHLLAARGIW